MSKKRLYANVCSKFVGVKMTEDQFNKINLWKRDFGCSSRSDAIRFIIDNFTPNHTLPPAEKNNKIFTDPKKKLTQEEIASLISAKK